MAQTARSHDSAAGAVGRVASGITGGALAAFGISRRSPVTLPLALIGGVLVYRGATGKWPLAQALGVATDRNGDATFKRAITIGREPAELYRFWRDFTNLPRFMQHLEEVRVIDERRSHWVAKAPLGAKAEWDAEITEDRPDELISWRSLPGAAVFNEGTVRFQPALGGRGTAILVEMRYDPPLGTAGRIAAKLAHEEPEQQVTDDLRHLKMIFEAGEIATNAMRPEDKKERA
jgi:uncharacterized membrane protein